MTGGTRMAAEMAEQPAAVRGLVARFREQAPALAPLAPTPGAGVVLLARGSSDHAAVFARYLFEWALGTPVVLAAPSLLTRYGRRPVLPGWTTIAISQSGRTPEIVTALEQLAASGSATVALTNDAGSPLALAAQHTVPLGAGEEVAVPATKTVTTSMAAVALIADAFAGGLWAPGDWSAVVEGIAEALADDAPAQAAGEVLASPAGSVHLGRGFSYPAALESALKLKESTGLVAEGASVADFLHGPVAALGGRPAACYLLEGPAAGDVREVAQRLARSGAPIVGVGADLPGAAVSLPVRAGLPEPLAVLPLVVRAQQIALAVARARGVDPDRPAGLAKITRTR
jgi:glucosamine--fructose-6-phosphate aminotransferase (isomerizing)